MLVKGRNDKMSVTNKFLHNYNFYLSKQVIIQIISYKGMYVNAKLLTLWKHQKTKGFWKVFRWYKMGTLVRNGLKFFNSQSFTFYPYIISLMTRIFLVIIV